MTRATITIDCESIEFAEDIQAYVAGRRERLVLELELQARINGLEAEKAAALGAVEIMRADRDDESVLLEAARTRIQQLEIQRDQQAEKIRTLTVAVDAMTAQRDRAIDERDAAKRRVTQLEAAPPLRTGGLLSRPLEKADVALQPAAPATGTCAACAHAARMHLDDGCRAASGQCECAGFAA
jgi:hypothetical protein